MSCCSFVFSRVKLGAPNCNTPIGAPAAPGDGERGCCSLQPLLAQVMGRGASMGPSGAPWTMHPSYPPFQPGGPACPREQVLEQRGGMRVAGRRPLRCASL